MSESHGGVASGNGFVGSQSRKKQRHDERKRKRFRAQKRAHVQRRAEQGKAFTHFLRRFAAHEILMQGFEPQLRRAILMTYRWCEDQGRRRPLVLELCIDHAIRHRAAPRFHPVAPPNAPVST